MRCWRSWLSRLTEDLPAIALGRGLLGAVLVIAASASAVAAEPEIAGAKHEWFEFRSEEGRFQVELPVEPKSHRESRSTMLGKVAETHHRLEFRGARIGIEVHELPGMAATIIPGSLILDRTRAGIVADMNGREVAARELTHQGYPARDFTYAVDEPEGFERALVVLVGSRVYVMTGLTSENPAEHPVVNRVFRSFIVWSTDDTQPTASPSG